MELKKKPGVSGKINKIVSGNDVMKFISKYKLFCCWIQGAINIHNNLKKNRILLILELGD